MSRQNVVRKVRNKAVRAHEQYTTTPFSINSSQDDVEDELGLFGGQTRMLDRQRAAPHGNISLHGLGGAAESVTAPDYLGNYTHVTHTLPPSTSFQAAPIQNEHPLAMSGGNQSYDMLLPEYQAPMQISIPEYSPEDDADVTEQSIQAEEVFGRDYEATSALDAQWFSFMHEIGVFDEGPHNA